MKYESLLVSGLLGCIILLMGCSTPKQEQDSVALGKAVFEKHECGKCHGASPEEAVMQAPDLSRPILANDSLYVQAHLKFTEESKMEPLELTDEEIRLVSSYIASLHASKQTPVPEEEADAICPICGVRVSSAMAMENNLQYEYLEKTFYFECQECLETFKSAPGVYALSAQEKEAKAEK